MAKAFCLLCTQHNVWRLKFQATETKSHCIWSFCELNFRVAFDSQFKMEGMLTYWLSLRISGKFKIPCKWIIRESHFTLIGHLGSFGESISQLLIPQNSNSIHLKNGLENVVDFWCSFPCTPLKTPKHKVCIRSIFMNPIDTLYKPSLSPPAQQPKI